MFSYLLHIFKCYEKKNHIELYCWQKCVHPYWTNNSKLNYYWDLSWTMSPDFCSFIAVYICLKMNSYEGKIKREKMTWVWGHTKLVRKKLVRLMSSGLSFKLLLKKGLLFWSYLTNDQFFFSLWEHFKTFSSFRSKLCSVGNIRTREKKTESALILLKFFLGNLDRHCVLM